MGPIEGTVIAGEYSIFLTPGYQWNFTRVRTLRVCVRSYRLDRTAAVSQCVDGHAILPRTDSTRARRRGRVLPRQEFAQADTAVHSERSVLVQLFT